MAAAAAAAGGGGGVAVVGAVAVGAVVSLGGVVGLGGVGGGGAGGGGGGGGGVEEVLAVNPDYSSVYKHVSYRRMVLAGFQHNWWRSGGLGPWNLSRL